jgi:hypothetical protein
MDIPIRPMYTCTPGFGENDMCLNEKYPNRFIDTPVNSLITAKTKNDTR